MEIKSVKVVVIVIGFSQVRERTRGQFLLRSRVLATLQRWIGKEVDKEEAPMWMIF
jgi:hypothetical protein